jgi:hypothetical protein
MHKPSAAMAIPRASPKLTSSLFPFAAALDDERQSLSDESGSADN